MRLADLAGIGGDSQVTGFAIDHRKVAPGTVFGAFRGTVFNGEDFIPASGERRRGGGRRPAGRSGRGRGPFAAEEPRREFARLAAKFFQPFPETVVAVTGTNGKTSNVELTRQLWRMTGHHAASIGTLGVTTADDRHHRPHHARHRHLPVQHGRPGARGRHPCRVRGFEPRLAQYRTEGLPVRAAAFTNFSRDHLDYHGTMEAYFEAKMRLFSEVVEPDGIAVVWTDDRSRRRWSRRRGARTQEADRRQKARPSS